MGIALQERWERALDGLPTDNGFTADLGTLQRLISEQYRQFKGKMPITKADDQHEHTPIVKTVDADVVAARGLVVQLEGLLGSLEAIESLLGEYEGTRASLHAKGLVLSNLFPQKDYRSAEIGKLEAILEPFQRAPSILERLSDTSTTSDSSSSLSDAIQMVQALRAATNQRVDEAEAVEKQYLVAIERTLEGIVERFIAEIGVLLQEHQQIPLTRIDTALRVMLTVADGGRFGRLVALTMEAHKDIQVDDSFARQIADTYFRLRRVTVLRAFGESVQEAKRASSYSLNSLFVRAHGLVVDEESLRAELVPWIPMEWWSIFGESLLPPILTYLRQAIDAAPDQERRSFGLALDAFISENLNSLHPLASRFASIIHLYFKEHNNK